LNGGLVGAGFVIDLDDAYSGDGIDLILNIGAEYKFNDTWGIILAGGANGASIGVGIHL